MSVQTSPHESATKAPTTRPPEPAGPVSAAEEPFSLLAAGPLSGAAAGTQADAARLQRTLGNQALLRASQVESGAGVVQRTPAGSHQSGCGCASCASLESIVARQNPAPVAGTLDAAPTIQRHHADEETLQRTPAGGEAHSAGHGAACGCPSCGSMTAIVQRTMDSVQRQSDAHQPGCGCPACSGPVQRSPERTLQRSPAGRTWSPVAPIGPAPFIRPIMTRQGVVQRHASWEHRALGDVDPDALSTLATWQEAADYYDQVQKARQGNKAMPPRIEIEGQEVNPSNILHILQQEVNRLKVWQDPENTPKRGGAASAEQLKEVAEDPEWQLHIVEVPGVPEGADPVVLTYGELNTLADFYGSADELLKTNSAAVLKVVQSVRQQSFEQLLSIYQKLYNEQDEAKAKKELGAENLSFKGAFNITGTSGELGQMAVDKKGAVSAEAGYSATLARNACHFAPESWHSWEDWHAKALAKAADAHRLYKQAEKAQQPEEDDGIGFSPFDVDFDSFFSQQAQGGEGVSSSELVVQQKEEPKGGKDDSDALTEEARAAENLALVYNGFGDHYLQDSYAAGHLINKTQVMQWFIKYLDKHPERTTFTSDTTWRQMQAMAYSQPGLSDAGQYDKDEIGKRKAGDSQEDVSTARNPQMVENTQDNKNISWTDRFKMLGLKIPGSVMSKGPALTLLLYLQENSGMTTTWTWKELKGKLGAKQLTGFFSKALAQFESKQIEGLANEGELKQAIRDLLKDHIVFMGKLQKNRFMPDTVDKSRSFTPDILSGKMGDDEIFVDTNTFELRKEYIQGKTGGVTGNTAKFNHAKGEIAKDNLEPYQKMVMATVYKDYVAWMRDSFIQKSTNALHDHFCVNGLTVKTGEGEEIGKIYGDMNMMNRDSAKGVKHSATTAQMSRDSILQMAAEGKVAATHTTAAILDRLPYEVEVGDDAYQPLDIWHNNPDLLQKTAEERVFANMTSASDIGAGTVSTVKSLGKITKDQDVHAGEAF